MITYNQSIDGGTFEDSTPYQLGEQAFKDGKSIFDYPYMANDPEADLWIDGYMDAEKHTLFL